MKHISAWTTLASLLYATACAHGTHSIETDPRALAAVQANVRLVNGETTFVTHGVGYELAGRTKGDLVRVQPELDRDATMLRRIFPNDSLSQVVVTVRRTTLPGKPYVEAAPIPQDVHVPVVEVVVPDAKVDQNGRRGGPFGGRSLTQPVVRAWLSAHASALTGKLAPRTQLKGEVEDSRIPAWADEMIPSLTADSIVDRVTTVVAAHPEALIPLAQYFTMERPTFAGLPAEDRSGESRNGGGSRGGMGGGIGGRGGMGGMGRGGMGRGGMGGGGGERGESRSQVTREAMPLQGAALFGAQSVVFGRYLVSREGYDYIGALVNAQVLGMGVDSVLAKRGTLNTTQQMDADFRRWVVERAAVVDR